MTTPTVPTAQVLLIDDDVDMRDVVQMILEDAGSRLTVAAHGAAALDVLRQAARVPDLICWIWACPSWMGERFATRSRRIGSGAPFR